MYFAKHETFHIREGWLTKGLLSIQEEPRIFLDSHAPQELGLGKNMVRALRFWMQATGLAIETFDAGLKVQVATDLGELIRDHDPYLELDGSLWLIHHQLVCSREFATSWYWFFNHYIPVRFTSQQFVERLGQWINTQQKKKISPNSLRRDFDVLLKTYLADNRNKSPEDVMESPLTALGLMSSFTESDEDGKKIRVYRYESATVKDIHPLIFLYVLQYSQELEREGATQVELRTALRESKNVGRTFNIGMTNFEDLLGRLNDNYPEWRVTLSRTGGLDVLTLPSVPKETLLNQFFNEQASIAKEIGRPCLEIQLS